METQNSKSKNVAKTPEVEACLADNRIIKPTPSSGVFRQYMAHEPSLATGAVALDVPIYTIDFKGFKLPIALKYLSNGIRVFDSPYPCGYGWSMHPGLRISRTIVGRPDELFPRAGVWDSSDPHYYEENMYDFCRRCMHEGAEPYVGYKLDAGHDIFTIHLAEKSYVRVVEFEDGKPVFLGADNELIIEADAKFESISVTDANGVKYVFTGVREGFVLEGTIVTSWMATEIMLPFGQQISLSWQRMTNSATHQRVLGKAVWNDEIDAASSCAHLPEVGADDELEQYVYADPHSAIHVLEKIEWPEGTVTISYDSKTNPTIKGLRVDSAEGNVKVVDFTYELTPFGGSLLTSLEISGEGIYNFSYNPGRFGSFTAQDWWGFYNGADGNQSLLPRVKMSSAEYLWQKHAYKYLTQDENDREPNAEAMKACILERVTYPAGGWTEYEYEPHRFAPKTEWTTPCIHAESNRPLSMGGGLRLAKTTTSAGDDSPSIVKTYTYGKDGDGWAVCEHVPSPITFLRQQWTQGVPSMPDGSDAGQSTFNYRRTITSAFSWCEDYDFGCSPIWYEEVTEVCGGAKTVNKLARVLPNNTIRTDQFSRYPLLIANAASRGPVVTSCERHARIDGEWKPMEKTELRYRDFSYSPDMRDAFVHQRIINTLTDEAPSYPLGDNGQGIVTQPILSGSVAFDVNEEDVYQLNECLLRLSVERAVTETITAYFSNGSVSQTIEYEYVDGTDLPAKVAVSDGAEDRVTRISYANAEGMAQKNMISCVATVEEERGAWIRGSRKAYSAVGDAFAPTKVHTCRDAAETESVSINYNPDGNPVCVSQLGLPICEIEWDSTGAYPKKKILRANEKVLIPDLGILLKSALRPVMAETHEWAYETKPLVGLASTTDPAGVKTAHTYDKCGRLIETSIEGHGPIVRYEYGIVSEGDHSNFVLKRKMLSANSGAAACVYYDGLGRPWQSAAEGAGFNGGAVCAITEYDSMGRKSDEWMGADAPGKMFSDAAAFKAIAAPCAFTAYGYGLSQGDEPDTVTRPGTLLHESGALAKTERFTNESAGMLACMELSVTSDGKLVKNGTYAPGRLVAAVCTDEDGRQSVAFSNLFGDKVMERRVIANGEFADTYFVQDGFGELRFMIPPLLADKLASTEDGSLWGIDDVDFDRYAFYYEYNAVGKPTLKKLPGREAVEIVYDRNMLPTLWRDGNLRSAGKWAYRICDGFCRPSLEGEAQISDSAASSMGRCIPFAKRDTNASHGYSVQGLPSGISLGEADLVTYYDNYDFIGDEEGYGCTTSSHSSAKGRLTGRRVNGRLEVYYYDLMGNMVERHARNACGHVDNDVVSYTYSGQPRNSALATAGPDGKSIVLETFRQYDALGRPSGISTRAGQTAVQSASYAYGPCGRLTKLTAGATPVGYGYDEQGRTSTISSAPLCMQITYENEVCMGGDTTTASWRYANGTARTMAYSYDSLDRLVGASLNGKPLASYAYDKHCSPLRIVRYGIEPTDADKTLALAYNGNQTSTLTAGEEDATLAWDANGNLCADSSRGIALISYDRNNLPKKVTLDDGRFIAFGYDALGRKFSQTLNSGLSIIVPVPFPTITPASSGDTTVKAASTTGTKEDGILRSWGELSRIDYVGPCVYVDRKLRRILIPGGYIEVDGDNMEYRFFISDHQGNVRAVVDQQGHLIEANDYYPYGTPMPTATSLSADLQPYKYAGKEQLSMWVSGSAEAGERSDALQGFSDFGPRWLATASATWTAPDPEAERYPGTSPYAYCAANPIRYIDPTGCKVEAKGSEEDVNTMKEKIDALKSSHLFRTIYKFLDSLNEFFSLSFGNPTTPTGESCNGYYDPNTNTIVIHHDVAKSSMSFYVTMAEELYHIYQKFTLFESVNIEFEAKVFAAIVYLQTKGSNAAFSHMDKGVEQLYFNMQDWTDDNNNIVFPFNFGQLYTNYCIDFVSSYLSIRCPPEYTKLSTRFPKRLSNLVFQK